MAEVRKVDGHIVPDFLMKFSDDDIRAIFSSSDVAPLVLGMTQEEVEHAVKEDRLAHLTQRECPEGCGCVHIYDDRDPDTIRAGIGPEICTDCDTCRGTM